MKSKEKYDSFHIINTISNEISQDSTHQNITKNLNTINNSKNNKRKNRKNNLHTNYHTNKNIKENNLITKRETKSEKKILNKHRKEFIPLPLINNELKKKESISLSNLEQMNNNSISYIKEKANINAYTNKENNHINKIIQIIIENNFLCKFHPTNRYTAYCSICKKNICQECLINKSHIDHKIYFLKDASPSDKLITYYKTLFIYSKYYLDRIREIIIELYNDLSDFSEKEKSNIKKPQIENIQKQLIKNYKQFYIKNYYQLQYAKKIISIFCYCKERKILNYQIIKNLYTIKINSVKIPDLSKQHIIIKAKTIIEFMIYNSNNILKSSDSSLPSTIYNYKNIGNKALSFNIKNNNTFNDLFTNNPEAIYESGVLQFKNDENDKEIKINFRLGNAQDKDNLKDIDIVSNINENLNQAIDEDNDNNNNNIIKEDYSKHEVIKIPKEIAKDNDKISSKKKKNSKDKEDNILKNIPKSILNNFDAEIQKYIFNNLPIPCQEEVEYKKNVQYLYFDKINKKEINCIYHGEFKKNTLVRHGRGLFIWEDGEFYLGYWVNDKREGKGTNNYANGDIYQGEYKNGKKEGKGTYKWSNGDTYIGNWRNDMKEGEGKYKCCNGDKYVGLFKMDKIEGNGLYIWANQNTYKGQFKNNEIEGKGILNYIYTNANKEIKDIHNKITFQKTKNNQDLDEKKNNANEDKKYIEIFTCNRSSINKNDEKDELDKNY